MHHRSFQIKKIISAFVRHKRTIEWRIYVHTYHGALYDLCTINEA